MKFKNCRQYSTIQFVQPNRKAEDTFVWYFALNNMEEQIISEVSENVKYIK